MSDSTKRLLIDECFGRQTAKLLDAFYKSVKLDIEVKHYLDKFPNGIDDSDWVSVIVNENWLILSSDRGKHGKGHGERLPLVCKRFEVSLIKVGTSIKSKGRIYIHRSLCWEAENIYNVCGKSEFNLYLITMSSGRTNFKIENKNWNRI